MGLLDALSSGSFDDPRNQAIMALGLGLLNSRGSFGNAVGQAGQQAMGVYQQAQDRQRQIEAQKLQQRMAQMQLEAAQHQAQQRANEEAFRQRLQSPQAQAAAQALSAGGGPTLTNAAKMPAVDPNSQLMFDAMQAGQMTPLQYIQTQQKDNSPLLLKEGETGYDRKTLKPLFSNPKTHEPPADWQLYQLSGAPAKGISYDQWDLQRKQAGATRVNVPVSLSTEKKYGEQFAGEVAKADMSLKDAAEKAPELANRALRVKQIISTGSPITGFGADFRLQASKALGVIGVTPSGNAAADTETLSTQLAANTLDQIKASGLGGGTGFSNADRDFLEKAVGGKITLEAKTLIRLADLSHRASVLTAMKWNQRAKQIPKSAIEGTGIDTSPVQIAPMTGQVMRFDANGNVVP